MRQMPNWGKMPPEMRECLDMMIHKTQRVLTGEFDNKEHWDDLVGYPQIIVKILDGEY